MDLRVELFTGRTVFVCGINPSDRVIKIKSRLYRKEGIPTWRQRLIFGDDELQDGLTIRDYGIGSGSKLKLLPHMKSGPISSSQRPQTYTTIDLMNALSEERADRRNSLPVPITIRIEPVSGTFRTKQSFAFGNREGHRETQSCYQLGNEVFHDSVEGEEAVVSAENARTRVTMAGIQRMLSRHKLRKVESCNVNPLRKPFSSPALNNPPDDLEPSEEDQAQDADCRQDPSCSSGGYICEAKMRGSIAPPPSPVNALTPKPSMRIPVQVSSSAQVSLAQGPQYCDDDDSQLCRCRVSYQEIGEPKISRPPRSSADFHCVYCGSSLRPDHLHRCKCRRLYCKYHIEPAKHQCTCRKCSTEVPEG